MSGAPSLRVRRVLVVVHVCFLRVLFIEVAVWTVRVLRRRVVVRVLVLGRQVLPAAGALFVVLQIVRHVHVRVAVLRRVMAVRFEAARVALVQALEHHEQKARATEYERQHR